MRNDRGIYMFILINRSNTHFEQATIFSAYKGYKNEEWKRYWESTLIYVKKSEILQKGITLNFFTQHTMHRFRTISIRIESVFLQRISINYQIPSTERIWSNHISIINRIQFIRIRWTYENGMILPWSCIESKLTRKIE